jgi:adenylate kinase family enzyme
VEREPVSSDYVPEMVVRYRRIVISGLPGVGKSELGRQIVQNALELEKNSNSIFWLSSAAETALRSGIYELAKGMSLLNENQADIDTVTKLVLKELNTRPMVDGPRQCR